MSAYVKGEDILDWADLWMRVDGPEMKMLAFDNMQNLRSREQWTGKNSKWCWMFPPKVEGSEQASC